MGVAADSASGQISTKPKPTPYCYQPNSQGFYSSHYALLVRTEGPPEPMIGTVEGQIRAMAPTVPVWGAQTMWQALGSSQGWADLRFAIIMAAGLGLIALVLVIGGVYGMVSYDVSQRTQEIGIRVALGASPWTIQRIIFRRGLVMLGIGLVVGVLGTLGLAVTLGHFV